MLVTNEIKNRQVYSYSYGRFWRLLKCDKKCCFCCRPKQKRQDFLYQGARHKLNEELDILEIIKKLRVHQFASQMVLKPHQRELINFFQDYKVQEPLEQLRKSHIMQDSRRDFGIRDVDADLSEINISKPEEEVFIEDEGLEDYSDPDLTLMDRKVQEKVLANLQSAISKLDPQDEIDAKIIKRVTDQLPISKKRGNNHLSGLTAQMIPQDMLLLQHIRQTNKLGISADAIRESRFQNGPRIDRSQQFGRPELLEDYY